MTIFFSSSTPLVTVTEIGLHNSGNFPKVPRVFRNPCLEEGGDKQNIRNPPTRIYGKPGDFGQVAVILLCLMEIYAL